MTHSQRQLQLWRLQAVISIAYKSGETKCLNGLKYIQHQTRSVMFAAVIFHKHLRPIVNVLALKNVKSRATEEPDFTLCWGGILG